MLKETNGKQTVILGDPDGKRTVSLLESLSVRKVLLVAGRSFASLPVAPAIERFPHVPFGGFSPNPQYADVRKGVLRYRKEGCDAVLAVGGGSAIDTAKCIKLFAGTGKGNYLDREYRDSGIPLVAVPTTAGTGSESTHFAVVYYRGKKRSVSHPSLLPVYAVLEPDVLRTLPPYQRVCSMLDAFCQSIESWWSVRSDEESRRLSRSAAMRIRRSAVSYLSGEKEGNRDMLYAANLAGRAIDGARTTAPHAMSYKLTSLFGIPHGHAVALCFPAVWDYMLDHPEFCADERGPAYVRGIFEDIAGTFGVSDPKQAVSAFRRMLGSLNIEAPECSDPAVTETLVRSVNLERLKNSPVRLDGRALRSLYRTILHL